MKPKLRAAILAGGKGTRFWPLSSDERPKQFLKLLSERSFLQNTVERTAPLVGIDNILISTTEPLARAAQKQLPDLRPSQFIVEPAPRGTLPCIALAFARILNDDTDAVAAALPADHLIPDAEAFRKTLQNAAQIALDAEKPILIGAQPTRPETGYGYIQTGASGPNGSLQIARFTEKPKRAEAEAMIAGGNVLWNCGMFVWKPSAFFKELRRRAPETAGIFQKIAQQPNELDALYRSLPNAAIDDALIEKMTEEAANGEATSGALVVPAEFDWDDIGSWNALWRRMPKDADGNAVRGPSASLETRNCLIYSQNKPIVTLGVEGLAMVETDEAVLICPLDKAQEVRKLVQTYNDAYNNAAGSE